MRLKIIRADDSIKHLAILGRLDVQAVSDIQYEFLHLTTTQPKSTIVDLSGMTYIASLGIGMLVSSAKYLERHGAKMVLLSPSELVRKALETSGLDHMVAITNEETAALELLR